MDRMFYLVLSRMRCFLSLSDIRLSCEDAVDLIERADALLSLPADIDLIEPSK